MTDFSIALSSLMARRLNVLVSVLLVAAGVALCTLLLCFTHHLETRMGRDGSGFDLVIGAKGSPLQIVLSSVYHIDIPTGNIDGSELKKWQGHKDVAKAIPLALGDNYKGFRIVGTTPDYPAHYKADMAQGAMWDKPFDAVAGASTHLNVGDQFHGAHGLMEDGHEHEDKTYRVTGVLKSTGTIIDRLILTSVASVQDLHDEHDHAEGHYHHDEDHGDITAIVIETRNKIANINLPRQINRDGNVMAANPAYEMTRLSSALGIGGKTLGVLSGVLLAISALGLFAGMSAAMENRKGDLAVLRAIGFSQARLIRLIAGEGIMIVAAGIAVGVAGGIGGAWALSQAVEPLKASGGLAAPWGGIAMLSVLVLGAGFAASLVPAWRAGKINVAEQLAAGV